MLVRRIAVTTSLLALGLAACGGSLTLTEYAERLESAVAVMNIRIDALDVQMEQATSLGEALRLWDERIAARNGLLEEFESLDPPQFATELHEAALDILGRLTAAEAAMGARAAQYEDVYSDFGEIWNTPEGRAARAIDEEAIAICQAGQAAFDETADREFIVDGPWIPSELSEVIDVVFGCTAAERGTAP